MQLFLFREWLYSFKRIIDLKPVAERFADYAKLRRTTTVIAAGFNHNFARCGGPLCQCTANVGNFAGAMRVENVPIYAQEVNYKRKS